MITLGRHSYAGETKLLFAAEVKTGNFTSISSNTTFMGRCEHPWVMNRQAVSNYPFRELKWGRGDKCGSRGPVNLGHDVWIGEQALILDGITIGSGAIVGAGSVVTKDVPPYAIVGGNPAKVLKYRFPADVIEALLKIAWWDWPDYKVREALPLMSDINKFLETYQ